MLLGAAVFDGRRCGVWICHPFEGKNRFGFRPIRRYREGYRGYHGQNCPRFVIVHSRQLFLVDLQSFAYGLLLSHFKPFPQA